MPILNMFKSRRGRSASLPRSPEGYWYDSEAHNPYGQRSTSGLSRAAQHAPHRASSRAPRYPAYGSSFPDSGAEPYAETLTDDQSWHRVEQPPEDYYQRGPRDRDHDSEYYSYSEDGTDRRSDASGPRARGGGPFPSFSNSEDSQMESTIPTVHRQDAPGHNGRLYEQFAGHPPPPPPPGPHAHPRAPASVTRLDLHDEEAGPFEGAGFDRRHQRGGPHGRASQHYHQSYATDPRRHHDPPQRRPSHQSYQHITVPSDSSRSDVLQTLEDGKHVPIPRQPMERRPSRSGNASYVQVPNAQRTYYIVPPGMNVIFRDEYGNELKRVGDFSETEDSDMYDEAPVELTDELGRLVYKTGGNYIDDASSDASDITFRPKVVHLGHYAPRGTAVPRPTREFPLTISLDRRGQHRNIRLEHSEDGSFSGSQGSERSFNPRLSHAHSEGNLAGHPPRSHSHFDPVRLRTIYP